MSVVLYRIDDRLVHGQVVVGWGRALDLERVILVDDEVAASPWEQDLYRMAMPAGMSVLFSSVSDAVPRLAQWNAEPVRTAVLVGSVDAAVVLSNSDPGALRQLNLGGIHHRPGRTERLPYLYLTDAEYTQLAALEAKGAQITGQDVPTATPVPLYELR